MNRYATFAVLALAAFALSTINSAPTADDSLDMDEALTQFSLQTTDDDEVAAVQDMKLGAFSDFCVQSRDYVLADVKQKTGHASSQGFSAFFKMAEDVAEAAMSTSQEASEQLTKQLANPSSAINGEGRVAETQRQMAGQSQPRALFTAVYGTVSATIDAVTSVVGAKVEELKQQIGVEKFTMIAQGGCRQAAAYKQELKQQFEQYKGAFTPEAAARFAKIDMEHVPCVTSTRIIRANGLCNLFNAVVNPAKELLAGVLSRKVVAEATAAE